MIFATRVNEVLQNLPLELGDAKKLVTTVRGGGYKICHLKIQFRNLCPPTHVLYSNTP